MKKQFGKSPLDRAVNQQTTENSNKSSNFNLMIYAFANCFLFICFVSWLIEQPMLLSILTPIFLLMNVLFLLIGLVFDKFKVKNFVDIISFIFASPIALIALYLLMAFGKRK